jgi:recombination associated protein RdgC
MPLTTGAVACRRYRVLDTPPDDYLAPFGKAIARNAFRPINDDKGETQSGGWASVRNILETTLNPSEWHLPPYIMLGYRLDKKSVPAKLLRAKLDLAIRDAMRSRESGKFSREEKSALELSIKTEMLKATAPSVGMTEVAWNLETGRVIVASTGSTVNELVIGAFAETFGLTPVPQFPYLLAEDWAEEKSRQADLTRAGADDFAALFRLRARQGGNIEMVDDLRAAGEGA